MKKKLLVVAVLVMLAAVPVRAAEGGHTVYLPLVVSPAEPEQQAPLGADARVVNLYVQSHRIGTYAWDVTVSGEIENTGGRWLTMTQVDLRFVDATGAIVGTYSPLLTLEYIAPGEHTAFMFEVEGNHEVVDVLVSPVIVEAPPAYDGLRLESGGLSGTVKNAGALACAFADVVATFRDAENHVVGLRHYYVPDLAPGAVGEYSIQPPNAEHSHYTVSVNDWLHWPCRWGPVPVP